MAAILRRRLVLSQGSRRRILTPHPDQVEHNHDATVERCPDLWRDFPKTIDVAAESSAALHDQINGHSSLRCGGRPPKYFRQQLRSEDPITNEDLSHLAAYFPEDLLPYLRVMLIRTAAGDPEGTAALLAEIAPEVGCSLTPVDAAPIALNQAMSGVLEKAARAVAIAAAALRNGTVEPEEATEFDEVANEIEAGLQEWRASRGKDVR